MLQFVARSARADGWNGSGRGTVEVTSCDPAQLIFYESGTWEPLNGGRIAFRNVFRWQHLNSNIIRLEHLRYGPDRPVFLFDLTRGSDGVWMSQDPHLCREDRYSAWLQVVGAEVSLRWSVTGPRKEEAIDYRYFP